MRIYDLIKEEKQEKPQVKLTQEQLYNQRLQEEMDKHSTPQTKTNRSNHAIK